jgi:hypothetical protein
MLVTNIQDIIKKAYSEALTKEQAPYNKINSTNEVDSTEEMLQVEQNFHSVFSTIVWFLEQDPFTNIAMHLDVNYRRVKQENFTAANRKDIHNAITKANGDTFQNTPIHLLFYEKIHEAKLSSDDMVLSLETPPEISSMSVCKLKKTTKFGVENLAYEMPLRLIERNATAQFVTAEQYEQLLFVLGQKPHNSPGQNCKEILTLFNDFPTNKVDNFKYMIHGLQLPFIYEDKKTLAENRREFKDFFSCLTNIRCAVVEGGHRCEAASRILQGYLLGDSIPLQQTGIDVPPNSTLFKPVQTQVYYCQDDDVKLDAFVLKYLRKISKKVAEQKNLIIQPTWDTFFDQVLVDISDHYLLQAAIYKKAEDFFDEEASYREMSDPYVKSNCIKKSLHEILTNAIFNYSPCKELIEAYDEKRKPKIENWEKNTQKWETLHADPYHIVSISYLKLLMIEVQSTY